MNEITLVIPFSLPPAELAADLLRELKMPALSALLARSTPGETGLHDRFARALPHELWLARRFGLIGADGVDSSLPVAALWMRALGLDPAPGYWCIVQPVHYHIARDHLVLTDLRRLDLSESDSRALFATALEAFDEAGLQLHYGRADCWFVQAARHGDLVTATPDATCGRNIDIWMPQGASARDWRKLHNEVQMAWHVHAVNERREAAGLTPVNALWLWGGAQADHLAHSPDGAGLKTGAGAAAGASPSAEGATALFNFDDWFAAFGACSGVAAPPAKAADAVLTHPAPQSMVLLDALIGPALAGDWAVWLERLQAMEAHWFAPVLAALQAGDLASVSLLLNHGTRLQQWRVSRNGLRQFWRKPSLHRLLP